MNYQNIWLDFSLKSKRMSSVNRGNEYQFESTSCVTAFRRNELCKSMERINYPRERVA